MEVKIGNKIVEIDRGTIEAVACQVYLFGEAVVELGDVKTEGSIVTFEMRLLMEGELDADGRPTPIPCL